MGWFFVCVLFPSYIQPNINLIFLGKTDKINQNLYGKSEFYLVI